MVLKLGITNNSRTCIDTSVSISTELVLTNFITDNPHTHNIDIGLSDHNFLFIALTNPKDSDPANFITKCTYSCDSLMFFSDR